MRSAASRSAIGPMRTRYRADAFEPLDCTYGEKPRAFNWCHNLSALARLAKLPSCTAQARCPSWTGARTDAGSAACVTLGFSADRLNMGDGGADSSASEGALAASSCTACGGELMMGGAPAAVPAGAAAGAGAAGAAGDAAGDAGAAGTGVDPAADPVAAAWLAARSTVTLRTGSGTLAGDPGTAAGFGPDNSSGATSTMNATRIDAPTRRSLTRRSMEW